jgi:lipoate---protein ligase
MQLLDLTLPTATENLALDEALLERAEQSGRPGEILRLWEPTSPLVVVGSSSRAGEEVKLDLCRGRNIPVVRRASGGATIVTGPGCLMYAVVLSYELRPALRSIDRAHRFVLDAIATPLQKITPELDIYRAGTSDLAANDRKFSGNSLRCKRTHLLYHGTLLYDFPLAQVAELLGTPPRQPDYRAGRAHSDFIRNLELPAATLRGALIDAFQADEPTSDWPRELTQQLVAEKYSRDDWNFRL